MRSLCCALLLMAGSCQPGPHPCDGLPDARDGSLADPERDDDGDGFVECLPWVGEATVAGGDCDDRDPSVFPGAPELCGDGLVNDCAGSVADARGACVEGAVTASQADARLLGAEGDGIFTAAPAGDVDGDGLPDLWVGGPWSARAGERAGIVYLATGPFQGERLLDHAETVLLGEPGGGIAGVSLAGLDADGDGHGDLLASARYLDEGRAYLVLGPVHGEHSLSEADLILEGEEPGNSAGCCVSDAGSAGGQGRFLLVGA